MVRLVCLLIGYCFGLMQTAYLYGKIIHVDIRKVGSGNAGTTNMLRSMGAKAGLITMAGDVSKCIIAILITWLIFHQAYPDLFPLLKIWTAAGVVIGHDFPFYMNFKGGKGIACTAGMIIAFGDWRWIIIGIILFFGLFFLTHYVSICSISLSLEFGLGIVIGSAVGLYDMTPARLTEMCILTWCIVALNIFQHRTNIGRLVHHSERKTYLSHKKNVAVEAERRKEGGNS